MSQHNALIYARLQVSGKISLVPVPAAVGNRYRATVGGKDSLFFLIYPCEVGKGFPAAVVSRPTNTLSLK